MGLYPSCLEESSQEVSKHVQEKTLTKNSSQDLHVKLKSLGRRDKGEQFQQLNQMYEPAMTAEGTDLYTAKANSRCGDVSGWGEDSCYVLSVTMLPAHLA